MSGAVALVCIADLVVEARGDHASAHILRGLDLEIGRGRVLGVVGESGSGKSTLASALMRLLPGNVSLSGRVEIDGTDILRLDERAMRDWRGRRIAMIFQDPMSALNPLFTVGTHLDDVVRRRFPALSRREARARAAAMLARVGIADPERRLAAYPHELSGGMRQRVMIAMALLVEPDLLIADEPTTALDSTVEAQIIALFGELRREFSGSIVFISHHLGLVAEFCDDICVLYGGTIAESGPLAEVLRAPRHPYTRALLDCEIDADAVGRLTTIPGEMPDVTRALDACVFAPRCPHVAPVCLAGQPTLVAVGEGRRAACVRTFDVLP